MLARPLHPGLAMLGRHDPIEELFFQIGGHELRGNLGVPQGAIGLAIVAGRGPADVAAALRARGLATLVVELASEPARPELDPWVDRLLAITDWTGGRSGIAHLPLGYVASDAAAAAALVAAARRPDRIRAIVVRGGRIDRAGAVLGRVRAPTLFLAGGRDDAAIEHDREAIAHMTTTTQLAIIPSTSALPGPGVSDEVAQLVAEWLVDHFAHEAALPAIHVPFTRPYRDRASAGTQLASALAHHTGRHPCVFGLSRGGVAVAAPIARALAAPLDVWLVRKLGMPIQPELGMGALAEGAALVLDPTLVRWSGARPEDVRALVHRKVDEIRRAARLYRGGGAPLAVRGRTVILVDEAIGTTSTPRAAIRGARRRGASRVIVATPVASLEALSALHGQADEVVCLASPPHLIAVSAWYQDLRRIAEHEVIGLLDEARGRDKRRPGGNARAGA
jgi:predicted phosphoribosyltransferase